MAHGLDLDFNEDEAAMRAAVERFCNQHPVADVARQADLPFPRALWRALAELGVFAPAAPGHEEAGGAVAVCAIAEILGHHVFPGPLAATYLAIQVLDRQERDDLINGRSLVSLSSADSTLLPWGTAADLFLVVDGAHIARGHAPACIEPVPTLGGDTWGRALLKIDAGLPQSSRALALAAIATAAYMTGAAWRLLRDTSEHAGTRRQFGKTLGEFQAVSHPLADCAIAITAAQTLARAAACSFDGADASRAETLAAGARWSAQRAGLATAFACHQVLGGIGITLEGPAFHITRRIRQLASTPPSGKREQALLLADTGLGA
ncbi:MAG: acyl-CoA dehydrogenase [Halioglobus sp.]